MTPVRLCMDMISSQSDMDSWTSCLRRRRVDGVHLYLISAQPLRGQHSEEALELILVAAAVGEDVLGRLAGGGFAAARRSAREPVGGRNFWLPGSADGPRGRADAAHASNCPIPLARGPCVNLSPTRTSPVREDGFPSPPRFEASGVRH